MKKIIGVLVGIMMLGLFGCSQHKYNLELDGYGLTAKKSTYAEGSLVKVIFDLIATDTNYSFYLDCDDTELDVDYKNGAYVITFIMPAHDVTLSLSSRNTMVYMPPIDITVENQIISADVWIMEDIQENRKKSLWGEPTVKKCAVNKPEQITIENVSDDNLYIVRMIDEKGMFYEVCSVEITDGQSIVIKTDAENLCTYLCVYDSDGSLNAEYEMFMAAL